MKKIFCLGPEGTYSTEAVEIAKATCLLNLFPNEKFEVEYLPTNEAVLDTCMDGEFGIVPVENSKSGLVPEVMQHRIANSSLPKVIGEVFLPVEHHLLVPKNMEMGDIRLVLSHPHALAQTRIKRRNLNLLDSQEMSSTGAAAKRVVEMRGKGMAAIASLYAKEVYGLKSLGKISDAPNNQTSFHILGTSNLAPTGNDKTTLIFELKDRPGELSKAIDVFMRNRVNLTCIHSVPLGEMHHYAFYCVAEFHQETLVGRKILRELQKIASMVRVLGSFPSAEINFLIATNLPKDTSIGIIGGNGAIGAFLRDFFTERKITNFFSDKNTSLTNIDVAKMSKVIFLSVPISIVPEVIKELAPHLDPHQLVINLSSVMETGDIHSRKHLKCSHSCIHFMATPRGKTFEGMPVLVSMPEEPDWRKWITSFLAEAEGEMIEVTPARHDRQRAYDQMQVAVIAMAFAITMSRSGIKCETFLKQASPTVRKMMGLGAYVTSKPELYSGIICGNSFSDEVIDQLLQSISSIRTSLHASLNNYRMNRLFAECREFFGSIHENLSQNFEEVLARVYIEK